MNSEQQIASKAIKQLLEPLPDSAKVEALNYLLAELTSVDLSKHPPAVRKALLEALPPVGTDTIAPLKVTSAATTPAASLEIAQKIFDSLELCEDGFVKLIVPAHVNEIEAMKALNLYFRQKVPDMKRGAISEKDFDLYATQPGVSNRDISKERVIEINVLVEGTRGKSRCNQIKVLKSRGLTLGPPEEVALVVGACACISQGEDLLNGSYTRTAVRRKTL